MSYLKNRKLDAVEMTVIDESLIRRAVEEERKNNPERIEEIEDSDFDFSEIETLCLSFKSKNPLHSLFLSFLFTILHTHFFTAKNNKVKQQ